MDQAWTLCVELTFYVALPAFAILVAIASRRIGHRRAEWIGVSLLFVGGLAAYVARSQGVDFPMWVTVLPINLPLFAGGMMLAIVNVSLAEREHDPAWLTKLTDRPGVLVSGALVAYALMVVVTWGSEGVLTYSSSERIAHYLLWCVIGFLSVAIAALGRQDVGVSRRALRLPAVAYLGVISYGIYLWHQTVLGEIYDRWLSPGQGFKQLAVMVALGFAVTVGVSSLSWFGLERPIMRFARRPLFERRSRPAE
jgi:peptidoglycan/LPS O-acetylase OafA/YrhL